MKHSFQLFVTSLLLAAVFSQPAEASVPLKDLAPAVQSASPGDTIVVADGFYSDIALTLTGCGSEGRPVVIKAEHPGKVVISGKSGLYLGGEWLVVEGFCFKDGEAYDGKAVISFKCDGSAANNCRITSCVVDNYNPVSRGDSFSYVHLFGRHNRVDHCSLLNKYNHGVTLIVMLDAESDRQNFHSIDHNYFGPRVVYGSNGAETMRVGTAQQCKSSSNTIITENWFDRCCGEVEVISIKSSDNIVSNNLFTECEGVLALRHGDRNLVEGNMFLGGNKRNTAGVRVVNSGHTIRNNVFADLQGYRFFAALALMNAVPNSLPNRYEQVKDVDIYDNLFINCKNLECGTGKDEERTLPPANVRFHDNVLYSSGEGKDIFTAVADKGGVICSDNKIARRAPQLPAEPVSRDAMGASWYSVNDDGEGVSEPRIIQVHSGQDNLCAAFANLADGDIVELADEGEYPISKGLEVRCKLTIRAKEGLASKPVIRFNGDKGANMISICDDGSLTVEGIAFNGFLQPGKVIAKAGISTAEKMIKPYDLTVDNCDFFNFGENSFNPIRGTKNTFATSVTVRNSRFYDLSGTAINFAAEKDDIGRYNADDIIIENCSFARILNVGVNIYRGGSDESTAGPYVEIRNCTFKDVCNMERGAVLRLIGPQILTVEDCLFDGSGRGGAAIRLDEATWEKISIHNCNLWNSGRILSMTGKAVDGPIYNAEPEYVDPEAYDFRQKSTSAMSKTAKRTIGIK